MPNKINTETESEFVTLSVDIPYELKDQLKFKSYKEKTPIKDIVKLALEKYLKESNK